MNPKPIKPLLTYLSLPLPQLTSPAQTRDLAPLPTSIPPSLGAALPIVALTSYLALTHSPTSPIKPGDRVFINGGSSSVGMLAIQLAKSRGAWVGTSCSEGSFGLVQGLGADEVCYWFRCAMLTRWLNHFFPYWTLDRSSTTEPLPCINNSLPPPSSPTPSSSTPSVSPSSSPTANHTSPPREPSSVSLPTTLGITRFGGT